MHYLIWKKTCELLQLERLGGSLGGEKGRDKRAVLYFLQLHGKLLVKENSGDGEIESSR